MRIVVKKANEEYGEIVEVENTLETFKSIVGGWIQTFPLTNDIYLVLNEEGKLLGLPPNLAIPCYDNEFEVIVGDVAIVSIDIDDFSGLEDKHLYVLKSIGIIE